MTRAQLRARGRRLFSDRVRAGDSIVGVVIGALPRSAVQVLEEMFGTAFQLGYEAGAQERLPVTERE